MGARIKEFETTIGEEGTVSDGIYIVTADGKLTDYNSADVTALGVVLVAGGHKFMIAKSDATDGTNMTLYWTKTISNLSLINYDNADGTNNQGRLGEELSNDFTTWTAGALSDFNGVTNTAIIAAASSDTRDMCTVLKTFNTSNSYNDWYVPTCGQLALMYLNMTEINAALEKIGGTVLVPGNYWSSSQFSSNNAWIVRFNEGLVDYGLKNYSSGRVRFVRNLTTIKKSLKEKVSEIETSIQNIIDNYATKTELPTKISQLENDVPYALKSDIEEKVNNVWNWTKLIGTITFSIDNKQYQALDGMTWEDWGSSDYNTSPYRKVGSTLKYEVMAGYYDPQQGIWIEGTTKYIYDGNTQTDITDVIEENKSYIGRL